MGVEHGKKMAQEINNKNEARNTLDSTRNLHLSPQDNKEIYKVKINKMKFWNKVELWDIATEMQTLNN